MQFGFTMPYFLDGGELCRFAQAAEALGFESVWTGDHIVLPTEGTNQYPYTEDGSFSRPSNAPFLETMTTLAYIAACTSRIRIGSTVIILPYRNPVVQAKMFASLDVLTNGRVICGVGVGWLEKEFDTLGVPYSERGAMSDECLEVFKTLWTQDYPEFHGRFFRFDGIQFYPKPVQKPHIPIWVGGHTRRAIRRVVAYGDAWHPTRQTPEYVASLLPYLRQQAEAAGRDPDEIKVSLKRTLHFTDLGVSEGSGGTRTLGAVVGTTDDVIDDIRHCTELGIGQLTYDFRTSDIGQCVRIMEHFAEKVVPRVAR
ncbi:MAG: LLM class F420-dependent oxidoreductase [Chloroflexi bacterium]|nr:LLM class F420-dependent oxidoreductase [Chloroflexota bacterium]